MLHKLGYEFVCGHCQEQKREQDFSKYNSGRIDEPVCNDCLSECTRCGAAEITQALVLSHCEICADDMGIS